MLSLTLMPDLDLERHTLDTSSPLRLPPQTSKLFTPQHRSHLCVSQGLHQVLQVGLGGAAGVVHGGPVRVQRHLGVNMCGYFICMKKRPGSSPGGPSHLGVKICENCG